MKKIIETIKINDYEVLTDEGWVDIEFLHKTIKYNKFIVKTKNNLILECADKHILFLENYDEIYVKDLIIGDKIITKYGTDEILEIIETDDEEHMYDLQLSDDSNHRYYTDDILSHNTSLLHCLSGIYTPTTGSIVIEGKTNTQLGEMGVVFQDYYIYPWRRVSKVLYLATLKNPNIKEIDRKNEVEKIVSEFNLGEHLNKFPCQLSGGQRQRVAIAEQILNGSEFLLLDEPFSGLDLIMLEKVFDTLIKVSMLDEKKTIIIISHDLSNCIALSDTVHILNKPIADRGATIVNSIDLADRGLAWTPGVKDLPEFRETLNEVKNYMR